MPQFRYQALNAENRPVAGEIVAESVGEAIHQLEAAGLMVQSIGYAGGTAAIAPSAQAAITGSATVTAFEQAILDTRLAKIVQHGLALAPALSAYAAELPASPERRRLHAFLQILQASDVSAAKVALTRQPHHWIPLLSSVADGGDHGEFLKTLLREYEPTADSSPRGRGRLVYPVVVLCVAMAVFLFIGVFVVPVFRDLFTSFGLRLPGLTQLVLAFYATITSGTFLLVAGLIVSGVLIATRISAAVAKSATGDGTSRPVGRPLAISRFSRHVADLIDADFSAPAALRLAAAASARPQLARAASRVAAALDGRGAPLKSADRRILTATLLYAVEADIPRAARSAALRELSRGYEDRARATFSWTEGFEPIGIVAVGFLVGATVLALYLPLFSLLQVLT